MRMSLEFQFTGLWFYSFPSFSLYVRVTSYSTDGAVRLTYLTNCKHPVSRYTMVRALGAGKTVISSPSSSSFTIYDTHPPWPSSHSSLQTANESNKTKKRWRDVFISVNAGGSLTPRSRRTHRDSRSQWEDQSRTSVCSIRGRSGGRLRSSRWCRALRVREWIGRREETGESERILQ